MPRRKLPCPKQSGRPRVFYFFVPSDLEPLRRVFDEMKVTKAKGSPTCYRADKPAKQIRNPNIERGPADRNKLQDKIKLKSGKSKTPNTKEACLGFYLFWSFEIVSNFGPRGFFHASNFSVSDPLCLCARHSYPDFFFITRIQIFVASF